MPKKSDQPRVQLSNSDIGHIGLSMSQHRLIGEIVSAWSDLERTLELLIWELFDVDMEHGKIITKRLSTDGILQTLRALAPLHYAGDQLKEVLADLNSINEVKEDRNFIVHGGWMRNRDGVALAASTKPKSDPFTVVVEGFSHSRFRAVHNRIRGLNGHIGGFLPSIRAETS